jgi:hypothetical protein
VHKPSDISVEEMSEDETFSDYHSLANDDESIASTNVTFQEERKFVVFQS